MAIGASLICGWVAFKKPTPMKLDYPKSFGNRISIPADNPTTVEGVYLGRKLFYEKKLSANNTLSCASCHEQAKAFTDGKTVSIGVDGKTTGRNAMALVNLLWNRKFFWDGRVEGLEAQAVFPITNPHEMGQSLAESVRKLKADTVYFGLFRKAFGDTNISSDRIVKAIAQFERTLISANSPYDRYLQNEYRPNALEIEGMALFANMPRPDKNIRGADCAHCHGGVKTYMELFHNNGLDRISADKGRQEVTGMQTDHGRFKIPTLRNIALTAPYMHDGRFATLEQVLDHYSEHLQTANLSSFLKDVSNKKGAVGLQLSAHEKKAVIAFLNMLTDSSFIYNPAFSDPNVY